MYYLAKAGYNVMGLEKFNFLHKNGSSHGDSIITRQSYMEGVEYVPFVLEAYKLFDELEKESGEKLFTKTGVINIGTKNS
ncbi:FAD-dependent oxidoreductase, partial [Propionibacterium freudenreichii]